MPAKRIVTGQKVSPVKLQRAKELRRKMMKAERILWSHLRTNKMGGFHFRRQQIIDGFIVDFYCHAASLVIEVDGGIHQKQKEYDEERDRVISAHQLRVLRFTNDEVEQELDAVLHKIEIACHADIET